MTKHPCRERPVRRNNPYKGGGLNLYREVRMSQVHLHDYEYLRGAAMADWAWEYLRRNPDYRSMALLHHRRGVSRQRLVTGPLLTRLRARHLHAEEWGLCSFR
jgi:hypothetical protein